MNQSKLHHFNPQFVLRGFADDGERITTIRLPERKSRTTRVRETGAENHLYSIPGHPDGFDVFEKGLGEGIEGETSNIFKSIADGVWPLPRDERDALAEFIALQTLRGPERRRQMESAATELWQKAAGQLGREGLEQAAADTVGRPLTEAESDELWASVTRTDGPPVAYTPRDHIEMMGEVTEPVAAILASRPWTLVRFKQRALITCDSPVSTVLYDDSGPLTGLAFAWLVLYPISRRTGLIMRDPMDGSGPDDDLDALIELAQSGALDDESVGTAAIEKMMNERTAAHAVSNLYHHPDDSRYVPSAYRQ